MSDSDLNVLHVVGSDTPAARLRTLAALLGRREVGVGSAGEGSAGEAPATGPELGRQRVVQLGCGQIESDALGTVERLSTPFGVGWLARRSLRSVVPSAGRTVLHVWSPNALSRVMPGAASERRMGALARRAGYRVLMDADAPLDVRRLVCGLSWLSSIDREVGHGGRGARRYSQAALRFVCPTDTARRRLLEAGVSLDDCALIRDSVDFAAVSEARRSDVRPRLDLGRADTVVLVLPPVLRETGALTAVWAAMLLGEVWPGVRVVVPDEGREVRRLTRLVESCRRRRMLRLVSWRFALPELVASADLVVYLPAGDAPVDGVAWAMAGGRPIVASAVRATTELLAHAHNAWLCRADNPKDAARRMLQALENQQQSQQQAALARSQVFRVFGRRRMIEQYRRAYDNLLADRRLADGIDDAALIR